MALSDLNNQFNTINKITESLGYKIPSELAIRMDYFSQIFSKNPTQTQAKMLNYINKIKNNQHLTNTESEEFSNVLTEFDKSLKQNMFLEYDLNGKVTAYLGNSSRA